MESAVNKSMIRQGIDDLIVYEHGLTMEEVKKTYGLCETIQLSSNENPLGTSPKVIEAMKLALENSSLYPDGGCKSLKQKVAAILGILEDMVIFSNGADNILLLIAQAFVNQGDEVIICDPTFSVYETVTRIMGGTIIKVPLKDYIYDLTAILERVSIKTKLIFVCNPNNPTGSILSETEVARFMQQVPPDCVVIFDEAYSEYVTEKDYPRTIQYVHNRRNVLMVRTFSKIYGLAGLRIGYAVGPKSLIEKLNKVVEAYPVNRVAQAGAMAALDDHEFLNRVLAVNKTGKQFMYEEFSKLGMSWVPSSTNFIFVNLGMNAKAVYHRLLAEGIVIRPANAWDMPHYARITIGTMQQNKKLIDALSRIKEEMDM